MKKSFYFNFVFILYLLLVVFFDQLHQIHQRPGQKYTTHLLLHLERI